MHSGVLRVVDITKQAIYTSTLQLKAYFSLLQDISQMYSDVDREHIVPGVELCYKLSRGVAANNPMPEEQAELARYTDNATKKVAEIVNAKQQQIMRTLRVSARRADEDTLKLEKEIQNFGIVAIDQQAKKAIEAEAREQQAAAQLILSNDARLVDSLVQDSEETDASEA